MQNQQTNQTYFLSSLLAFAIVHQFVYRIHTYSPYSGHLSIKCNFVSFIAVQMHRELQDDEFFKEFRI